MKSIKISLAIILALWFMPSRAQKSKQQVYFEQIEIAGAILSSIQNYFVDTVNLAQVHTSGLNAMLQRLDPYTEYMSQEQAKAFREATSGSYAGIGSIISQRPDGTVIINEPFEKQPAQEAGLRAGDRILAVDNVDCTGKTTAEISAMLRGVEGSPVTIQVKRRGHSSPLTFSFKRKKVTLNQVVYADRLKGDIGFIRLSQFTLESVNDFKEALASIQKEGTPLKGLILDLRGNGGGLLQGAIELLSCFVPKGTTVLEVRGKETKENNFISTEKDPIHSDLPLVVLIDDESASASEIVAGALQDLDRAVIVGEKSFGKGLVQSTIPTPYDGLLKITTARYYIPSGRCIQKISYDHLGSRAPINPTDSLGKAFTTQRGRVVYDAGGIMPDIVISEDSIPAIVNHIALDTLVYDYITDYEQKHPQMASPQKFHLTDTEYREFLNYLERNKFTYEPYSIRLLNELKKIVQIEQMQELSAQEIEKLQQALSPNIQRDGIRFRKNIQTYLESQIILRRYHRRWIMAPLIDSDKQLQEGLRLIQSPSRMQKILQP